MYHHSTLGLTTPQQSRRQQDFSVNSLSNGVYNAQITSSGVPKTSDYAQLVSSTARQGSVHREGKGSTYGGRKVMISSRSVSSFVSETRSTREGTRWEAYTCDESIIEGYSRGGGHRQAAKDRRPQDTLLANYGRSISLASSASSYYSDSSSVAPSLAPTLQHPSSSSLSVDSLDTSSDGIEVDELELVQFRDLSTPFALPSSPIFGSYPFGSPKSSYVPSNRFPEIPRASIDIPSPARPAVLQRRSSSSGRVPPRGLYPAIPSPARRIAMAYSSSSGTITPGVPWTGLKNVSAVDRLRIKNFAPSIATTTRSNKSVVSMKGTQMDPRVYMKVGDNGMVRWKIRKRRISRAPWEEAEDEWERIQEARSEARFKVATPVEVVQPIVVATRLSTLSSAEVPLLFTLNHRTSIASCRSGGSVYADAISGSPDPSCPESFGESVPPSLDSSHQKPNTRAMGTTVFVGGSSDAPVDVDAIPPVEVSQRDEEGDRGYDRRIENLELGPDVFFGSFNMSTPQSSSRARDYTISALPPSPSLPSFPTLRPISPTFDPSRSIYAPPRRPSLPPKSTSFMSFRPFANLFRKKSVPTLRHSPHTTFLSYDATSRRASFKSNRTSWLVSEIEDDDTFGETSRVSEIREGSEQVKVLEGLFDRFSMDEVRRFRDISMRNQSVVAL